jgi:hypothetical protein
MNTTDTKSKSSTLIRDSKGRFSSAKAVKAKRSVVLPSRDSKGRFVASKPTVLLRDSKGKFTSSSGKVSGATIKSGFIKSMTIQGMSVNVIMTRNPKVTYTYRPDASGLRAVKDALSTGGSLGVVYHDHLKNREVSRTIYR